MSEQIPNKLLEQLIKNFNVSKKEADSWKLKLDELTKLFLNSEATVYCEDCGLIFYSGKAQPVACEKNYVDWKMLSFRHAWDTQHKVKVYLPFFTAQMAELNFKSAAMFGFTKQAFKQLDFDEFNQINYSLSVERLRNNLIASGDGAAFHKNDFNWDAGSRCSCSVCHKEYYDPKAACLCHRELKQWLPLGEVESIKVRRLVH
jgi:hypothetical protein